MIQLFAAAFVALAGPSAAVTPAPAWARLPSVPPLPARQRSGDFKNGEAKLHFAQFNPDGGSPVVLLHGGLGSSNYWGFEVPLLMKRHRVIVMDSRCHGRSSCPTGPLSYRILAGDVIKLLNHLRLKRASIVGASDGGIIGLIIAIEHPRRIDRLFAWGANFNTHAKPATPPDPSLRQLGASYVARMEMEYRRLSPTPGGFGDLRKKLSEMYAKEPDISTGQLGRIQAPTVIADGDHEQFISAEHTKVLAASIPHAALVIIPNASHGGPIQNPDAFHTAVTALLDTQK